MPEPLQTCVMCGGPIDGYVATLPPHIEKFQKFCYRDWHWHQWTRTGELTEAGEVKFKHNGTLKEYDVAEQFGDDEVVSAINGCIDFDKLRALPQVVRNRFAELVKHRRVQPVCFFVTAGFGLRIYQDEIVEVDDDECTRREAAKGVSMKLGLGGYWMRCPPKLYLDKTKPKPIYRFAVMDSTGEWYVSKDSLFAFLSDVTKREGSKIHLTGDRSAARLFNRQSNANRAAKEMTTDRGPGVVIQVEVDSKGQAIKRFADSKEEVKKPTPAFGGTVADRLDKMLDAEPPDDVEG